MAFKIVEHIDFDKSGRAACPACLLEGKKAKNLALVPNTDGAYKCHRGHSAEEIRGAIGQAPSPEARAEAQVQAKSQPPLAKITTGDAKVDEAASALGQSTLALPWLLNRGIPLDAVKHYRLGVMRSKWEENYYWSVSIPIPTGQPGRYYNKKRLIPWVPKAERPEGMKPWSQWGIPNIAYITHSPESPTETWIVAGEWDAIALGWRVKNHPVLSQTVKVLTYLHGEGSVPPDLSAVEGTPVTFYDLDDPGKEGAQKILTALGRGKMAVVPHTPPAAEGYDTSDALNAGTPVEAFAESARKGRDWQPVTTTTKASPAVNPLKARMKWNKDLIANAPDHIDWLVPDLLTPNELFILGAPPRGGKSLFLLTLAKAIASGGNFLDRPTTQGTVIYVNCEDGDVKVKLRQEAQGWGAIQEDYDLPVVWFEEFKLSELDHLRELCIEIGDVRLLVLDTLSRVRDDGCKETSPDMSRVLEPLQRMARELNICILISHHLSEKEIDPKGDIFTLLRGNSSIRATCRGAFVIVATDGGYRIVSENGWADKQDFLARINPNTWEWQLMGRWAPRVDGSIKDKCLDYLNLHASGTVEAIAHDLCVKASSVGNALCKLQQEGMLIKKGGNGRSPAVYHRSLTLFHQGETRCETYNPYEVRDTSVVSPNPESAKPQEKVCSGKKSMQQNTPLLNSPPPVSDFVTQRTEPMSAEQSMSHQAKILVRQSETNPETAPEICPLTVGNSTPPLPPRPTPGQKVRYRGSNYQTGRICGKKWLTVQSVQENDEGVWITATHPALLVAQTLPLAQVDVRTGDVANAS